MGNFKAHSKRRGRPAKQGKRYHCGKLVQKGEQETEREAKAVVLDMRSRIHGLTGKDAESSLAGSTLGRIRLDKAINEAQFKAGEWYAEDMARYYALVGIPHPSPAAQNMFAIRGHEGETSEERATAARKATNKMMALETVLLSVPNGPRVKSTVFSVCVMDYENLRAMPDTQMQWLREGLNALVWHYGRSE